MKEEVLAGIQEMINEGENYFFDFDNGKTASYVLIRGTETERYAIDIEVEVHVEIHDTLGMLLTGLELKELNVYDASGEEQYIEITDKEFEDQLTIF
jgi:hypothetical protein